MDGPVGVWTRARIKGDRRRRSRKDAARKGTSRTKCNVGTLKRKTGAQDEAQRPASIETTSSTAHAVLSVSVCSLRPAICSLHSAAEAAFPECRLLFVPLLLLLLLMLLLLLLLVPIRQSQHIPCQPAPQTLPRSSDWPSMPSQGHSSSMRLLIRRSTNNQRGG